MVCTFIIMKFYGTRGNKENLEIDEIYAVVKQPICIFV